MSKTIDQRVVEMRFDNKSFEQNVQTTMSTLDKLKQKLNLTGASKGLENIDSQAKNVKLSGISNAVDTVSTKFSALQVMGVTALANITNSAVNAGKKIVSALTIDPIKTGFQEYETQMNAVQTILANTSSKGTNLDDVNKALDELNTYADKTIYNFTEMTRNIGTFTAAGVDLDTSVSAIKGIANLAAVSGSSSQQASTAMYQLSQALANGRVNLQDWNSVVNAGMGGEVFQNALKRTAENMGTDVDALIKKYGSFRESLTQGEWLTSDVLTKTLEQFTMAAEEGSDAWNKYKKSLMSEGYTEKQAIEILKMANTATSAATEVKTFTQLWDTLKESAQSGWTQTWEILVGDFEEAKELLTGISNVVGGFIGKTADARNNLLQGWKEAGGRTDTIKALTNLFEGFVNIVKPIKEAFSEIFPPLTVKQLLSFTDRFKELTGNFADFTEKHGPQIKSTFKGIFSVLDIVVTIISKVASGIFKITGSLLGFTGGILSGTATLGDFLTNIRNSIKESNLFGKAIDKVVTTIQNGINKVKEFGNSLKKSFEQTGYEGFFGFIKGIWEFVKQLDSIVTKALGGVGQAIANAFGENKFGDVLNSGLFSALLVGMFKFVNNLNGPLKKLSGMFDEVKEGVGNVKGILEDVRGCLQAYQDQLKAGTLLKIAGAIGILAASIFVISRIDPEAIGRSLAAISVLFAELLLSMSLFSKIPSLKGAWRAIPLMLSMSASLLILAGAMKIIGSMKPEQMITGLVGIAGGMAVLIGALHLLPEKNVNKASKAIRKMSVALLILSAALKVMGSMSWGELARGLTGAVVGLAAMVAAVNLLPKDTALRTLGLVNLAGALVILGAALKVMGSMSWGEIGRGLTVLAGALVAIVAAVRLMPKNMILISVGLIGVTTALMILSRALNNMGSMSWKEIGKGLTVLGGALLILSVALFAMKNSLVGSAALLVAASALTILTLSLKILGGMSWKAIIKSLTALAGVFIVIGVAGAVLSGLVPSILALSVACALFGVSAVAIGAGLALIATGITLLATAMAAGATAIVAGITVIITGLLDLVPTIASKLGEAIKTFAKVIGDCAPQIADSVLKLISELLKSLATYVPVIADSLFELLIGVLNVIASRAPELIVAIAKVINGIFIGAAEALKNLDGANLLKGAIAVGIMAALVAVLASISSMVGPAMIGLLGVGALIAELTLILAAIGALNKIPGLADFVSSGGNLLERIGTAIGQFIGGIAGGIAQGFSSSLPDIANDLSDFMKNIQPFINGARNIDKSVIGGVINLVAAIGAVTVAGFASKIADFISIGKDPLTKFSEQIIPLGKAMKAYGEEVAGVDSAAIIASAKAAKGLTDVANAIPKSGGLFNLFTGSDSLLSFAIQLVPFGKALKKYASEVAGIDTQAIITSASAAKAIAEMANIIPNSGGMVAWFTGDNSLANFSTEMVALGKGLKDFSNETAGIVPENIIACSNAAKTLAEMFAIIPNEGGMVAWFTGENSVSRFAGSLKSLGKGLKDFSIETADIVPENIVACSNAAKALAEMFAIIPNEGGMVAWFTGENSVSKFAGNLKTLGTGLKDFSNETADIVPENIIAASGAAKALAEMADTIPNEGGMVSWFAGDNSVAKFAGNLKPLGTGLKDFSNEVSEVKAENVIAAANAAKALAEMVNIIPNEGGMKAWFVGDSSIATFADKLPELGKGLKGFSNEVSEIKTENVTAAANSAKALAEMANTVPKKTDKIIEFGENLVTFGEKLKSYFDKTTGITSEMIKTSKDAIASIKTATTGINKDSLMGVSNAIDDLVDSLKSMASISESSVNGFCESMKKLGSANIKTITTSFNNAGPTLKQAGSDIVTNLESGITSKQKSLNKACNAIAEKMSSCVTTIKGYKFSFYNAGLDLCQGLINGLSNVQKRTAVYNAAYSLGQLAVQGEHDGQESASPSKATERAGKWLGEGLIVGIKKIGSRVYSAGENMGEKATNSISNALDTALSLLNTNMNTEPTIRPVLDLSDIQSGVGTIGNMFDDVGVNANLNAISSGMRLRNQNGTNNDVVSAIDALRKDLGNVSGTTNNYNVNGVTYDDGSNITEAVKTIIRAAIQERRV